MKKNEIESELEKELFAKAEMIHQRHSGLSPYECMDVALRIVGMEQREDFLDGFVNTLTKAFPGIVAAPVVPVKKFDA